MAMQEMCDLPFQFFFFCKLTSVVYSDPGITEVFSRGQNPQHWHVAKRGLGSNGGDSGGEVYLEVFRKEASLTDVDNVLAGIVRRSSLVDGSV